DGYRLEADDQIIVVDGALSTVYDAARNRVIISEYDAEEDDFAPSRLLSGLDETYVLAGEESSGGITTINLESNDDFAVFVGISIEVGSDLHPQKITATDFAENVIITGFSNGEFLSDAEGIFELSPPEDAEIVDMRY
ncbi:MAG TPA: outer membrane lipoprotein carrier protein LolA, partial [Balneolaceae bacterium]|nr:outer membrane lipoprotein carrier protein LolA [Balneolaceae bacterium]